MLFLLVELGSHIFIDHHGHETTDHSEEHATLTVEDDHECELYIACTEHDGEDSQLPGPQDQSTHHDVLIASNVLNFVREVRYTDSILFEQSIVATPISQLPFHPPKV